MRVTTLFSTMTLVVLALSSCANLTYVNEPLEHWTPARQQANAEQLKQARSPELLVLVAFSGGGTRAAAFAYGALKELSKTQIATREGSHSLLSEVDIISSVSGGSFASAYYGLRGDKIFDEFEDRFLRQDVEGSLLLQLFNPINWFRLMSSTFSRTDIAAKHYDEILFDNATFADLKRPGAPIVLINSTDLATGLQFSFQEGFFDLICSDLNKYPVSRAVAASSAVPILFSPITLKSYAGECGFTLPRSLTTDEGTGQFNLRHKEIRALREYLNKEERPWLHLVDGGIADNLGLRPFYNFISAIGGHDTALGSIDYSKLRQVLIISVNARATPPAHWSLEQDAPGLSEVINSISSDQIDLYSADSIQLVRDAYTLWAAAKSTPKHKIDFHFVELSFDEVKEEKERNFLNEIGTNFDLTNEQVDHLISSAGTLLRDSPDLRAFIEHSNNGVIE